MVSCAFVFVLFAAFLIDSTYAVCPPNWVAHNRDCCSPTFGFNSTAPTLNVAQGVDFPVAITVWNDSSHWGLGIDTDWSTLNIFWGQMTGTRSKPYGVNGLIDVVRIFYQPDKGLYGLRFHDSAGFSPIFGMATSTYVDLAYGGQPFSGWGVITHQFQLLNSVAACFRMK